MNLLSITEQRVSDIERAIKQAHAAKAQIRKAAAKTAEVLEIASKAGVSVVGLNRGLGEGSWGERPGPGCLFTMQSERTNGWPTAWHIAEKAGISAGCGNLGQHQIPSDSVIDGVYVCTDGQWTLLSDEDAHELYKANRRAATRGDAQ